MYLISYINPIKVKVKFTLEQITKAQRGSRYSFILLTSVLATPRPLYPQYPLYGNPIRKRKHAWQDQSSSKYYIFGLNYSKVIDPEDLKNNHLLSTYVQRIFYPKSGHPDRKNKKFPLFKFF
jgi:hypothetical protein